MTTWGMATELATANHNCHLFMESKGSLLQCKFTVNATSLITARIQRMGGGGEVLFSVCQFTPRLWGGGGGYPIWLTGGGGEYPVPGPDGGEGGDTSSCSWGLPHLRSGQGVSTPIQDQDGGHPCQDWMGVPLHPGLDEVPCPGLFGIPPPIQDCMGKPPPPPPCQETDQHSQHLLRGRQCASCVHAGGLSCLISISVRIVRINQ